MHWSGRPRRIWMEVLALFALAKTRSPLLPKPAFSDRLDKACSHLRQFAHEGRPITFHSSHTKVEFLHDPAAVSPSMATSLLLKILATCIGIWLICKSRRRSKQSTLKPGFRERLKHRTGIVLPENCYVSREFAESVYHIAYVMYTEDKVRRRWKRSVKKFDATFADHSIPRLHRDRVRAELEACLTAT